MKKEKYLLELVLNAVKSYKKYFFDMTYKLYTNCNDEMDIVFPVNEFFNCLNINKLDYEDLKSYIKNADGNIKIKIHDGCQKFAGICPLTTDFIHSIIDCNNKTYVITVSEKGITVLVLTKIFQEKNKSKYIITKIEKRNFIREIINHRDSKIYFPTKSIVKSYNEEDIISQLSKKERKEKLLKLKETIYYDKDGNVRNQNTRINPNFFIKKIKENVK